ncbi:MAG: hypothetical protein ABJA62_01280 [Luteimonas sp.]
MRGQRAQQRYLSLQWCLYGLSSIVGTMVSPYRFTDVGLNGFAAS